MTISPTQLAAENSPAIRASFHSGFNALAPVKQQLPINWTTPLDVPSDITVEVGGITFSLHKAHPSLTDVERKKLCRLLDFQKLSQEACTHAAQNERLPVQAVVQVLYFEQLRIRNVMAGSYHPEAGAGGDAAVANHNEARSATRNASINKISNGVLSASPKDHYASVRRENRELKLEVARMRMRLSDLEKDHLHMKLDMEKGHPPNHGHRHGLFHAVTKSISKLNPFHHHKLNPFHSQQHQYSRSQPEPQSQRRVSSLSSSSSQASSFEQSRKEHSNSSRKKRHSLS